MDASDPTDRLLKNWDRLASELKKGRENTEPPRNQSAGARRPTNEPAKDDQPQIGPPGKGGRTADQQAPAPFVGVSLHGVSTRKQASARRQGRSNVQPEIPAFLRAAFDPETAARRARSRRARWLRSASGRALTVFAGVVAAGTTVAGASYLQDVDLVRVLTGSSKAPDLEIRDARGREDSAVPLSVRAFAAEGTELETLHVLGLPAGFALSHGDKSESGEWLVPLPDIEHLSLIPVENFHGDLSLTARATARSGEDIETAVEHFKVLISAVADVPDLRVADVTGKEDQSVSLNLIAAASDAQEELAVVIRGLPEGAVLSAGAPSAEGWQLAAEDFRDLALTLPSNFRGAIPLQVEATATDDDDSVLIGRRFVVDIEPVADTPRLSVQAAEGVEDQPIPVEIVAATADSAETIALEVSGLPPGARLSAGIQDGDGAWLVEPSEARGMSLLPPPNFSGVIPLSVTASARDGRDQSSTAQAIEVLVAPAADEPTLALEDAAAAEDEAIPLVIVAASRDASEVVNVRVTGLPDGATLSTGTRQEDGAWLIAAADLAGLALQAPAHFSGALDLRVEAVSTDGSDVASVESTLNVKVSPVADAARLNGLSAAGKEDEPVALELAAITEDPSETLSVLVSDLPEDASFSSGRDNGDGTWTLEADELPGLLFNAPPDMNGQLGLPVVVTSLDGADHETTTGRLEINIAAVADAARLTVASASGTEDIPVPLQIRLDAPANETTWVMLTGVPGDAFLSAGEPDSDNAWRLDPTELPGLKLVPATNFSGVLSLEALAVTADGADRAEQRASFQVKLAPVADRPVLSADAAAGTEDAPIPINLRADVTDPSEAVSLHFAGIPAGASLSAGTQESEGTWVVAAAELAGLRFNPPPEFSGSIPLDVSAVSLDGETTATVSQALAIEVAPVADAPTLTLSPATGPEDTPLPLAVSVASRDASETVSVVLSGLPTGARLSSGERQSDGSWLLQADDLSGLELTPPPDESGSFSISIEATTIDGTHEASTREEMLVTIAPVAEVPDVRANDASGVEDEPIALNLQARSSDPSESVSVILAGLPADASLTSGSRLEDGRWELRAPDDLDGLQVIPTPDFSGELPLEIVAISTDEGVGAETSATLTLSVAAVADPAKLSVNPAAGAEDQPIALPISVEKAAREELSLQIAGLPPGASLSAGKRAEEDGSWLLSAGDVEDLALAPPDNFSGVMELSVSATTIDGGDTATVSAGLPIVVRPVADDPQVSAKNASGIEDEPVPLRIAAASPDQSEELDLHVWGVPAESFLTAGRRVSAGHWVVGPQALADLMLIPPMNFSGAVDLHLAAETADGDDSTVVWERMTVAIEPVADLPVVTATAAIGLEDTPIPLTINAGSADPSEQLTVSVAQLPQGATLTQGRSIDDGVVTLTVQELADISLLPPPHFSGTLELVVTATSSDQGRSSSTTAPLDIIVQPVADRPSLAVRDAIGIEDGIIALEIDAQTADPSEQLLLRIAGLPAGSALSSGAAVTDTVWEVADGLRSLSLVPPADFSGQLDLQVTASSIDGEETAAVDAAMKVGIVPVADAPDLVANDVSGTAGQPLPLAISVRRTTPRETITLTLSGLPEDFVLSTGQVGDDGEWLLQPTDLEGLAVLPPSETIGAFNAQVRATATDGSDRAMVETSFTVAVVPASEGPPTQSVGLVPPANASVGSIGTVDAANDVVPPVEPAPPRPDVAAVQPPAETPLESVEATATQATPDDPQTARLVERARDLLQLGDLAGARLLYEAAAEAGSADAALGIGQTYDPVFLSTRDLFGARPDPAEAMRWYQTARDKRHADAAKSIARLREWMDQAGIVLPAVQ